MAIQSGDEQRVRRAIDDIAEHLDRHRCGGADSSGIRRAKAATISSVTSPICSISTAMALLRDMRMAPRRIRMSEAFARRLQE